MNQLFVILCLTACIQGKKDTLVNTKWISKVSESCVDTLIFEKNNRAKIYSCEMTYTFHGSYKMAKDTVTLTQKDDSHGNKVELFRTTYLLKNNSLYFISTSEFSNNKWHLQKVEDSATAPFTKISK